MRCRVVPCGAVPCHVVPCCREQQLPGRKFVWYDILQSPPAIAQKRSAAPCGAVRCRAVPCGAVPCQVVESNSYLMASSSGRRMVRYLACFLDRVVNSFHSYTAAADKNIGLSRQMYRHTSKGFGANTEAFNPPSQ